MSQNGTVEPQPIPVKDNQQGAVLGKLGNLITRLAVEPAEIAAAQQVRYQVFCEEYSALIAQQNRDQMREADGHDAFCDHLLVEQVSSDGRRQIIGTQRFFLRLPGAKGARLYSQGAFDVESLIERHKQKVFMELGRSCILPEFRSKRTMELMWQGTWAYAVERNVDVMIGCASFHASNADEIAPALKFLGTHAGLDRGWSCDAIGPQAIRAIDLPVEAEQTRAVLKSLPPLIKGYMRLGAMFSREAVPDPDFGTIDVLVVLPVDRINPRYVKYYGADASKHRG